MYIFTNSPFVGDMVEDIHRINSSLTLLLVTKDKIDPVVKMVTNIITLERLSSLISLPPAIERTTTTYFSMSLYENFGIVVCPRR